MNIHKNFNHVFKNSQTPPKCLPLLNVSFNVSLNYNRLEEWFVVFSKLCKREVKMNFDQLAFYNETDIIKIPLSGTHLVLFVDIGRCCNF